MHRSTGVVATILVVCLAHGTGFATTTPTPRVLLRAGRARSGVQLRGGGTDGQADDSYVLVTGGAGYIGSHTCLELLNAGQKVVVVDNLCNSDPESMTRVRKLTGCEEDALIFREVDICDPTGLEAILEEFPSIDSCVHFAGLKAVGESVAEPLSYYENNIGGTTVLLKLLQKHGVKRLVFSSSATVYGDPDTLPIQETAALRTTNPYGRTKLFIEDILRDVAVADPSWQILILRYFNPIGAHVSGEIGEDPQGIPNNLMPFVAQVAVGRRPELAVFGDDYDTVDGTGVRDYIHVVDLAQGHLAALEKLRGDDTTGCVAVNLGTGQGISVLQLVEAMGKAVGKPIPYSIAPRRPGDVGSCYCDPALAKSHLGWEAKLGVTEMCEDTWRWQSANPVGYRKQ